MHEPCSITFPGRRKVGQPSQLIIPISQNFSPAIYPKFLFSFLIPVEQLTDEQPEFCVATGPNTNSHYLHLVKLIEGAIGLYVM